MKFDRVPEEKNGKGKLIFGITEPDKLEKIINILGYDARQLTALHVNFGILEEDCCRTAFLAGRIFGGWKRHRPGEAVSSGAGYQPCAGQPGGAGADGGDGGSCHVPYGAARMHFCTSNNQSILRTF